MSGFVILIQPNLTLSIRRIMRNDHRWEPVISTRPVLFPLPPLHRGQSVLLNCMRNKPLLLSDISAGQNANCMIMIFIFTVRINIEIQAKSQILIKTQIQAHSRTKTWWKPVSQSSSITHEVEENADGTLTGWMWATCTWAVCPC